MAGGPPPRVIGPVLACQGNQSHPRKCQKNKAGYLKPELMEHTAEMTEGGPGTFQNSRVGPRALDLLSGNASSNPQFSGG